MNPIQYFYKTNPFPGRYTDIDIQNIFESWPYNIDIKGNILDAGCGTGMFSHVFSKKAKAVTGIDFSDESLDIAKKYSVDNNITNTSFKIHDLNDRILFGNNYDMIYCGGVLHHIKNPDIPFQHLIDVLKPGGKIIIGLYHPLGRIATYMKRPFIKFSPIFKSLDKRYRRSNNSRRESWIVDQYFCPYETSYTITRAIKTFFEPYGITHLSTFPNKVFSRYSFENGGFYLLEGQLL